MEDGIIIAKHDAVLDALEFLQSEQVKAYGFHLRMDKTSVWWPTPHAQTTRERYPPTIYNNGTAGTHVLSVPIGTHEFMEPQMDRYIKKADRVRRLNELNDVYVTFVLLRAVFGAGQLNYHLRARSYDAKKQAAKLYDDQVGSCLGDLAMGTLPDQLLGELSLPLRIFDPTRPLFEVFVTSAMHCASAAYLASRLATHGAVKSLLMRDDSVNTNTNSDCRLTEARTALILGDVLADTAFDDYRARSSHPHPPPTLSKLLTDTPLEQLSQKALLAHAYRKRIETLQLGDERTCANRTAQSLAGAKDWLKCTPSPRNNTYFAGRDFRVWFAFYCRRPLLNRAKAIQHSIRSNCSKSMDMYGDHLLYYNTASRACNAPVARRHDQLTRLLAEDLAAAARLPRVEPRTYEQLERSRLDKVVLGAHGGEDILDLAIVHHWGTRRYQDRASAHNTFAMLNTLHTNKRRHRREYARRRPGSRVIPIIVSNAGGWHNSSQKSLLKLAAEIARRNMLPPDLVRAQMMHRFATRLVASNARCLITGRRLA